MKSMILAGAVAGLTACTAAASASAAPVTVDLRVEGPTRTLVEQKVTVDVRRFKFSDSAQTYKCDDTQGNGSRNPSPFPVPTRGAAIAQAAEVGGLELLGTFDPNQGSPTFTRINGESIPPYAQESKYLREILNGSDSQVGSCGDPIANGDDVLFAYGNGSEPLLLLSGPVTAKPGESATFTVTDQADRRGVGGASVAGGTSGTDGRATSTTFSQRGPQTFKATKAGDIRSNAVTVCVTDGADGFCGTTKPGQPSTATTTPDSSTPSVSTPPVATAPDRVAAFAKLSSITEGKRFAKGHGPRILAGRVDDEAAGLKDVRLRLSRTSGKRCSRYDGAKEQFAATRTCGVKNARTFSVGANRAFSYLLPATLPAGRYVLDVIVLDRAGNQTTTYQRGRNRVVFVVG